MSINVGTFRTLLSVERRSVQQDKLGEQLTDWGAIGSAWAFVDKLAGRELLAAQSMHAASSHQITMRYFPGLTAKDRFVYTDPEGTVRYYNILEVVDVDMRHFYMICTAQEGLASG